MNDKVAFVPIIDVSPLFSDEAGLEKTAVDEAIGTACEQARGFLATGLPRPLRPDEAQTKKLLAFYNLPQSARDDVAIRRMRPTSERAYRGYSATLRDGWAHNEIYDIGPEPPVSGPSIKGVETLIESNAWPSVEPMPDWQEEMVSYYQHMHDFSERLIRSMARYLGVDEEAAAARYQNSNSTLRLLNYPATPADIIVGDEANAVRLYDGVEHRLMAMEHKDQCCLSLLWQDESGGLQLQAADETWLAVPQVSDGVSVHIGMAMETMTGGTFTATPHRVLGQGNARQSIGFFFEPALDRSVLPFTKETFEATPAHEDTYATALLKTFAEREARRKEKERAKQAR
jgi:isopenicillin N synthase-like dioxygenase